MLRQPLETFVFTLQINSKTSFNQFGEGLKKQEEEVKRKEAEQKKRLKAASEKREKEVAK